MARHEQGDIAGALAEARRSLELAPRDAATLYVLAEASRPEGKIDAALAALEGVLALAPGHPQAAERLELLRRHRQARLDPAPSPH